MRLNQLQNNLHATATVRVYYPNAHIYYGRLTELEIDHDYRIYSNHNIQLREHGETITVTVLP